MHVNRQELICHQIELFFFYVFLCFFVVFIQQYQVMLRLFRFSLQNILNYSLMILLLSLFTIFISLHTLIIICFLAVWIYKMWIKAWVQCLAYQTDFFQLSDLKVLWFQKIHLKNMPQPWTSDSKQIWVRALKWSTMGLILSICCKIIDHQNWLSEKSPSLGRF